MISPFEFKTTRKILAAFVLIASFTCHLSIVSAQEADGASDAKAQYEAALLKGRELAKACRNVSLRFFDSSRADSRKWEKKWPTVAKDLADHKPVFEQAAVEWFMECERPDPELLELVSLVSYQLYNSGQHELTWKVLHKIKEFYPGDDTTMLQLQIALVGVKTNRFDQALAFLQKPEARDALKEIDQLDKNTLLMSPLLASKWEREKKLRDAEAEADDLPRVKIQLTTGEVIVELFENEAPVTVANFISRVESGFYDGSYCHPHIKGIVLQSGLVNRSHNRPIDYMIKNESRQEDARDHFTGSLTMSSMKGDKGTSSTVFAFTLLPNPDLDWERTEEDDESQPVFGRVVSGLEHVVSLPVTMETDEETKEQKPRTDITPGFIEKATVIRKRDHEYTFEKIRSQPE